MNQKKGQASLEFLTTYGWAIFAMLAIIGILLYSGITDVSNNIPESCSFSTGTSCGAFYGLEDGRYAFEITNMQRAPIKITNISCSYLDDTYTIDLLGGVVGVGDSAVLYCNASKHVSSLPEVFSGTHKFKTKIYYNFNETEALPKVMSGEIVIGVSDDPAVLSQYTSSPKLIS